MLDSIGTCGWVQRPTGPIIPTIIRENGEPGWISVLALV